MTQPPSPLTMLFSRHTKRREFITLVGGTAAAWPYVARAQQAERERRIGVLMSVAADGPEGQARLTAFQQGLQQLGCAGPNSVQIAFSETMSVKDSVSTALSRVAA
jgi:putative ABC transport system substrate-binding protein